MCGCRTCVRALDRAAGSHDEANLRELVMAGKFPIEGSRMILCPTCGNKRCPHANDHLNACTNSNATGQQGSAYP